MNRFWMPINIGDFRSETAHFNPAERGIYVSLIFYAWENGGNIPLDDRKICRITGCDPRLWWQYKGNILPLFDTVDASTVQHRKVVQELHRLDEISSKRKAAAQQMLSKRSANVVQLLPHLQLQRKKEDIPANAGSGKYAFQEGNIRLNQQDFDKWSKAFSQLELSAELLSLAPWAETLGKDWFHPVKAALNKRNRQAKLTVSASTTKDLGWSGIEGVV
jgi:uncharacterized protein YdaU (DUF1376 family)